MILDEGNSPLNSPGGEAMSQRSALWPRRGASSGCRLGSPSSSISQRALARFITRNNPKEPDVSTSKIHAYLRGLPRASNWNGSGLSSPGLTLGLVTQGSTTPCLMTGLVLRTVISER